MNAETRLATLIDKLRLPGASQLEPWLARLVADPDSIVIISIEKPLWPEPRVGTAWLSGRERLKVRQALQRLNESRARKGEHFTDEIPD
jgi:hypothetical protein